MVGCLTMRLDSANVDSIIDIFIEHMRNSSIDMNLVNGMWSLGAIFHCIRLVSQCHHLITDIAIVIFSSFVFTEFVLVDNSHDAIGSVGVLCEISVISVDIDFCTPQDSSAHSLRISTTQSISSSTAGCLSCAVDDFCEKKAIVLFFCFVTPASCRSDASVQMSKGMFGSGKERRTCSGMRLSMPCLQMPFAAVEF